MTDDLNQPANFDARNKRAELIAQRAAVKGYSAEAVTERMRLSVEIEKLRHQELRERGEE